MLYQKLLYGRDPYVLSAAAARAFGRHYHHEIELSFCAKGEYALQVGGQSLLLHEGDLAVINSMALHEYPSAHPDALRLTIELSPDALGDLFAPFTAQSADCERVCAADQPELTRLLFALTAACRQGDCFAELTAKGLLYTALSRLLPLLAARRQMELSPKSAQNTHGIEKALEIIYTRYPEPLSIADVSRECGYEASNFCKIFKQNTGDTFHKLLNRHRIDVACHLLGRQEQSIEQIAYAVGFADVKNFCRVFKAAKGMTAGAYRKQAIRPASAP